MDKATSYSKTEVLKYFDPKVFRQKAPTTQKLAVEDCFCDS